MRPARKNANGRCSRYDDRRVARRAVFSLEAAFRASTRPGAVVDSARRSSRRSFSQSVQTPRTCARRREVQPREAKEHGRLAAIDERPETLRCMTHEVCGCHFSRQDEGDRSREEPEEQERPANYLDHARETEQRQERNAGAWFGGRKPRGPPLARARPSSTDPSLSASIDRLNRSGNRVAAAPGRSRSHALRSSQSRIVTTAASAPIQTTVFRIRPL